MINVQSNYNILNDCKYIRNVDRCQHDSNCGFDARFNQGDCGFTTTSGLYSNIAPGRFLWATSEASSCSISMTSDLVYTFETDYFSDCEIDMLVRYNKYVSGTLPDTLTGQIRWKTVTDQTWNQDSYIDFDVYPDGDWHHYKFTMLTSQQWVGNCQNIMLCPFIDGAPNVEIIIQRIAFTSDSYYKCKYPPCAYNPHYTHPCPAVGTSASVTSLTRVEQVSLDAQHNRIGIEFDNYPLRYIDLDLAHINDCYSVAQEITLKMNSLNLGGFKFAECQYDSIGQCFSIYTGTKGKLGTALLIKGDINDATELLGFYQNGSINYKLTGGTNPADGFVEAYKKLSATILYRLPNSDSSLIQYDPADYLVEMGRSDLTTVTSETFMDEGSVGGSLFIDFLGGASYEGNISSLKYHGDITDSSQIFLLRPYKENSYQIIQNVLLTSAASISGSSLYQLDVEWDVRVGDVCALYMCKPALGPEINTKATLEMHYPYSWIDLRDSNLYTGKILEYQSSDIKFYGYGSLPIYGYSTELNPGYAIESELRYEYGISYAAIISEQRDDSFDFDLTTLSGTQVEISTNNGIVSSSLISDSNLLLAFDNTVSVYWIDFIFPGYIHNIYQINTTFAAPLNIRTFAWEGYIEPLFRAGLSWNGQYNFFTEAPYLGSAVGWIRLSDPLSVTTDGNKDMTSNLYLGYDYVTNSPFDYYPGISDDLRVQRMNDAYDISWTTLSQKFSPFPTRGIRLWVWSWADPRITDISIIGTFPTVNSLLRAVNMIGLSGPEVFSNEKYNVIDTEGTSWVSSTIGRATTTEYSYGLNFAYQGTDYTTIIAPVGTTMSKFYLTIDKFPIRIKQVVLIPQDIAQQLRTSESEPITEISNLSWGAPSNGSQFTYGPSKSYEIFNDTGHPANLRVGVADPLAIDESCVFYSDLSSDDAVSNPAIGDKAILRRASNQGINADYCIDYHARAYTMFPQVPDNWLSSTNSGIVWQTLVSGNPLTTPVSWNEPTDPNNKFWSLSNWCQASDISVSAGQLSITQLSKIYTLNQNIWLNPTYFVSSTIDTSCSIETQVIYNSARAGIDASAGIVIYDNQDYSKFFRIERYTGNAVATVSGLITDFNKQYAYPAGDYIRYGNASQYYTTNNSPIILNLSQQDYGVLFRLYKFKSKVDISWRLPWTTWTTISSFDISGWSNDLRMGIFGASQAISKSATAIQTIASFSYLLYRGDNLYLSEQFNQDYSFSSQTTTISGWSTVNAQQASTLASNQTGLTIRNYQAPQGFRFFNQKLQTPALQTQWGSITDYGRIISRLTNYDSYMMASGIFSSGFLLTDSSNTSNYVKFAMRTSSSLELTVTGSVSYVTIDDTPSVSGIWLMLDKGSSILLPSYSYNGIDYIVASGIYLGDWSSNAPIELSLSTDTSVTFDNLSVGTSQIDATSLAAQFNTGFPLLNIYGRDQNFVNFRYSASSDMTSLSTDQPTMVYIIAFDKDQSFFVNLDSLKFIPDPYQAKQNIFELRTSEILYRNKQLWDYTGEMNTTNPVITESGTGYTTSSGLSFKGLPIYDYPVLAIDMGNQYQIGRAPNMMSNINGRFSTSDTDMFPSVDWESTSTASGGFSRTCIYSNSNQCTAPSQYGKPKMIYNGGDVPAYYFAGPCDGITTDAGAVNKACPLFSCGYARWLFFESQNFTTTSASADSVWQIGPIQTGPATSNIPITNNIEWWVTDVGSLYWVDGTKTEPNYTLIYGYPGFNLNGSCYFNARGNPYWRFVRDTEWTHDDRLSIDLKCIAPVLPDSVELRIGRDPKCCFSFTITGTLSSDWQTFELPYRDANTIISSDIALTEPALTENNLEYYQVENTPYLPLPYMDCGYAKLTVSGSRGANIYMRNLYNKRITYDSNMLYLGLDESLYVPDIDLMNEGSISLTYYPSEYATKIKQGDPRKFIYSVCTVSNPDCGIQVALDLQAGWMMYCFSPKEQLVFTCMPTSKIASFIIPSISNPGPFEIVLSWAPTNLPGLNYTAVLWVNGLIACEGTFTSLGDYFTTDNIKVTLGKSGTPLQDNDIYPHAGYARFSNLKIYKRAVGAPILNIDDSLLTPENMIELSTDNSDWKSFNDGTLPLLFFGVQPGESRIFYLRNKRPRKDIKKLQRRSNANLSIKWEVHQ